MAPQAQRDSLVACRDASRRRNQWSKNAKRCTLTPQHDGKTVDPIICFHVRKGNVTTRTGGVERTGTTSGVSNTSILLRSRNGGALRVGSKLDSDEGCLGGRGSNYSDGGT